MVLCHGALGILGSRSITAPVLWPLKSISRNVRTRVASSGGWPTLTRLKVETWRDSFRGIAWAPLKTNNCSSENWWFEDDISISNWGPFPERRVTYNFQEGGGVIFIGWSNKVSEGRWRLVVVGQPWNWWPNGRVESRALCPPNCGPVLMLHNPKKRLFHQEFNRTLPTDPYASCNRAVRYSGLGVRSVGPLGNFLELSLEVNPPFLSTF